MRELLGFVGGVAFAFVSIVLTAKTAQPIANTPHPLQAIESAKIGPLDAFAGKFGQNTRIWLVAPKSGQTLEITATDSEITVGTRRIGETAGQVGP